MNRRGPPPPPPPGPPPYWEFPAAPPRYEGELSETGAIDLFYNVTLEDRMEPDISGGYYYLLEHPFERVQPKNPPQVSQKAPSIIEIILLATRIPYKPRLRQVPLADDDKNNESEGDRKEDDAKIGESKYGGNFWERNKEQFEKRLEKYQFQSFHVVSMMIHSSHLQALLRSVIVYYPTFNLKGNKIDVPYPFKPLFHYYNDLVALQMNCKSKKMEEGHLTSTNIPGEIIAQTQSKALDQDTLHALDVLLAYLKPFYLSLIQREESRYREGLASHGLLWFLFKPGSDVYARVDGKLAAFVFEGFSNLVEGRAVIKCWHLAYKGRRVTKVITEFTIYEFYGEREILSLPVFPCTYFDKSDKGKTKASLESLGEKYYEILKEVPAYRAYSGYAWGQRRKTVKGKKSSEERTYVCSNTDT
jgi:hypothetical protein